MDVSTCLSRFRGVMILGLIISSCAQEKSTSSVFPESQKTSSSACMGQAIENKYILHWEDGRFSVVENMQKEEFIKTVVEPQLDKLKHVDVDRKIMVRQDDISLQARVTEDSVNSKTWHLGMIEANALWSRNIYGQGVIVGVVDSFVDVDHVQLSARILKNSGEIANNGVDDDGNGYVDDVRGYVFYKNSTSTTSNSAHGTHVTGIIAADSSFGEVQGVAPQSKIVPAQFIDGSGGGSLGDGILAMQYAASRGAKIINASWGGAPCVDNLRSVFAQLSSAGVLLVVAAGNDGNDVDVTPEFPASFNLPNQLTVAAASLDDLLTWWSNRGFQRVHVAAPGDSIYSTIPGGSDYMSGTSMAAPVVSGAAALIWSAKPSATAGEIKQALMKTVDVQTSREYKVASQGRINVRKALDYLLAN